MVLLEGQGTAGTGGNTLRALLALVITEGLIGKGGNYPPKAAVGKTQDTFVQAFAAYPHAATTENAFIRVVGEKRVAVIRREFPHKLSEMLWFKLNPKVPGYVLELAATINSTVGTVHRV